MRFKYSFLAGVVLVFSFLTVTPAGAEGWITQRDERNDLRDIHMVSTTKGYAVGADGTLLKTSDGTNWSSMTQPSGGAGAEYYAVEAVGDTVFVFGVNRMYRSTTGGASWTDIRPAGLDLDGTPELWGTDFINSSIGWVVGKKGDSAIVLRTTTGGDSWTSQQSGLPAGVNALRAISCINGTICYAVGDNGKIVRTANGGTSWSAQSASTPKILYGVQMLSSTVAWAVGDEGVIRQTTNGLAWTNPGNPTKRDLRGIDFTSSSIGMIVGELGTALRTENGGMNWDTLELPAGGATITLNAVDMVSTTIGWAAGTSGTIYRYDGTVPTVSAVTPTTATAGQAQTYSATYSDNFGVTSCVLLYSDAAPSIPMTLSAPGGTSGTATASHTFSVVGAAQLQVRCTDTAENRGVGAMTSITVASANRAPNPPSDLAQRAELNGPDQSVGWTSTDSGIVFGGVVSDPDGDDAWLQIEVKALGVAFGNTATDFDLPVASGSTVQISRSYFGEGSYHWQARVSDGLGGVSAWAPFGGNPESEADFVIDLPAAGGGEPEAPATFDTVISSGPSSPTTATTATFLFGVPAGTPVNGFTFECSLDGAAFVACASPRTYSGLGVGTHTFRARTVSGGTPDPTPATYNWSIEAVAPAASGGDAGGVAPGSAEPVTPAGVLPAGFQIGDLVKLADDRNPNTFGDSSVFYLGADGGRYVFTNDKAYFSWYVDFSGVRIISSADLAAVPLRGNVTYRPGVRMVKLQTNPTVYVVTARGVLRAVSSEAVAVALYGSNWNREIDDINDAFWTNYGVGAPLGSAAEFNRTAVRDAARNINIDRGLAL